ncbi:GDP-mannose-dependent alpha-mannosyltransferase [compost metagenome]
MRKLVIVTDAWHPQVNGVVRTLSTTIEHLKDYEVHVIHPGLFRNFALPKYPEIRIAFPFGVAKKIKQIEPDHIHIATEGPLGWAAMLWCRMRSREFSTSYHTQFPQYLSKIYGIPERLTFGVLRFFHSRATSVMANTPDMIRQLETQGFNNIKLWSRGVDTSVFKPEGPKHPELAVLRGPILLNVGRVSAEKNLPAFYEGNREFTLVQVGDGPMLEAYKRDYPWVHFLGAKHGEELAQIYRSASVFVFPSKSDTFGLVMLEAMASGVPVAAFPVTGPIDVVEDGYSGALDDDLCEAIDRAYESKPEDCIAHAKKFSWAACTEQFRKNLA